MPLCGMPLCGYTQSFIGIGAFEKKVEAEELDVVISPRNLENWAKLAKYDGYVKAAEKTLIPVAKCDRTLEDTIRGIMMLYKWKV